jgi:hypothetical protein
MKELYKYINISNFEQVQVELFNCIKEDYRDAIKPIAFSYPTDYIYSSCPSLKQWLKPINKMPIRLFRFYITPPGKKLGAHIDGGGHLPTVPFGINIPVAGCKDTYHTFYQCDESNLSAQTPKGYLSGIHPNDYTKLVPIERLEILKPCFTNNQIMHGVENNSSEFRIMFTIRWILNHRIGRTIEEVINTKGIFNE